LRQKNLSHPTGLIGHKISKEAYFTGQVQPESGLCVFAYPKWAVDVPVVVMAEAICIKRGSA